MRNIQIMPMEKEDLEDIIAVERAVFPDPWSQTMFAEQLELPEIYSLITARMDDRVAGYGGLLRIRDEGHITNLAVHPEAQSQGLGKSLVYFLFLLALKESVKSMTLEVRTTNTRAQELYSQFGLEPIALRKNYYGYEEDALVMTIEDISVASYQRRLADIQKSLKCHIQDSLNLAS